MDVCKQKKGEGVQAFMDRCRATQLSADRSIPDGDKTGNHVNCYVRRYNTSVLDLFLRGLREEQGLKGHVNGANATTRDEYLAEAIRYEIHVTKPVKMVVVAEVAKEEDDGQEEDDQEVAAMQPKAKGKKKKNGGQGQGGGAKGNGGGGGNYGGGGRGGGGGYRGGRGARGGRGGGGGGSEAKLCWNCNSSDHLSYRCPEPKKTGGGGGNRGGGRGGGASSYGGPSVNEMLGRLMFDNMMRSQQGGSVQGDLESIQFGAPPTYRSNSSYGGPGSLQGFQ